MPVLRRNNRIHSSSSYVKKLLDVMEGEPALSSKELMEKLNLKSRIYLEIII